MRTTLNIHDDLYRQIRIRAAEKGATVTSVVEEALVRLLESSGPTHEERFRLRPIGPTGRPAARVDLHDNAALLDLLDEDVKVSSRR